MVKSAEARIKAYSQKIDADVIRSRISALKDSMVEKATVKQTELATIQADIKSELEDLGVPPEFTVPFLRIAMRLYGLTNKHKGNMLKVEAQAYINAVASKLYDFVKDATLVQNYLQFLVDYFGLTGITVPTPPTGG